MKREAELRQRREEYARKAEVTVKLAHNWQESRLLGDFGVAFEASTKTKTLSEEQ